SLPPDTATDEITHGRDRNARLADATSDFPVTLNTAPPDSLVKWASIERSPPGKPVWNAKMELARPESAAVDSAQRLSSPQVDAPSLSKKTSHLSLPSGDQLGAATSASAPARSVAPSSASSLASAIRASTLSLVLSTNDSRHHWRFTSKKRTAN